jgi:hypothetical protein
MGAGQNVRTGSTEYYVLKEEKVDGVGTNILWFFKSSKDGGGEKYPTMSGYLTGLEVEDYDYQGPKKRLLIKLRCQDTGKAIQVQIGFSSSTCRNTLNSLATMDHSKGLFLIGGVESKNEYPVLWVNTLSGEKTDWKYSRKNGNYEKIPVVTKDEDEDGNIIKKGVKAATQFWIDLVNEIQKNLEATGLSNASAPAKVDAKPVSENKNFENEGPRKQNESAQLKKEDWTGKKSILEEDDLPF